MWVESLIICKETLYLMNEIRGLDQKHFENFHVHEIFVTTAQDREWQRQLNLLNNNFEYCWTGFCTFLSEKFG